MMSASPSMSMKLWMADQDPEQVLLCCLQLMKGDALAVERYRPFLN